MAVSHSDTTHNTAKIKHYGRNSAARAVLDVVCVGEESSHYSCNIGTDGTDVLGAHEPLVDELQDFMAESRFGWGQQRQRVADS